MDGLYPYNEMIQNFLENFITAEVAFQTTVQRTLHGKLISKEDQLKSVVYMKEVILPQFAEMAKRDLVPLHPGQWAVAFDNYMALLKARLDAKDAAEKSK